MALKRMRVVYLLQASASVSSEQRPKFQRKRERERKIHKERERKIHKVIGRSFACRKILTNSRKNNFKRRIILHHDDASSHTAIQRNTFLKEKDVELLRNRIQNPDLAPRCISTYFMYLRKTSRFVLAFPAKSNRTATENLLHNLFDPDLDSTDLDYDSIPTVNPEVHDVLR
ncbi:hypothetical protein EVAR_92359_1 [Eumeta japonica]|uniref:Mariner Mos1 transposase n=1 Tax=Eumeta variegata TaxID=151549 RepID=A0A4C1TJR9_EUMVA|nr:hypothetical protein EVAR_92359_1 [Eumeta japonica]